MDSEGVLNSALGHSQPETEVDSKYSDRMLQTEDERLHEQSWTYLIYRGIVGVQHTLRLSANLQFVDLWRGWSTPLEQNKL